MIDRLGWELGRSVAKVITFVAIFFIAVLPMVALFHTRPETAGSRSECTLARALAEEPLDRARNLPYGVVEKRLPNAPCFFDVSGPCELTNRQDLHGENPDFRHEVVKQNV